MSTMDVMLTNLHICVYYITADNKVQELALSTFNDQRAVGPVLGEVFCDSNFLYVLKFARLAPRWLSFIQVRVGYQSVSNPNTIIESYIISNVGWAARQHPSMM
jgi:hypothetical protein